MARKITILCNDFIGQRMAGTAIRSVEIARCLSEHFDVTVAAPDIGEDLDFPFSCISTRSNGFRNSISASDVILLQGSALKEYPFLKDSNAALIADLYCPIPLEYHQASVGKDIAERNSTIAYLAGMQAEQLAYSDYFLCANERQRDFWSGALMLSSRINALRWPNAKDAKIPDLLAMLPFGLPEAKPVQSRKGIRELFNIPEDDFVLVWGGGIYQWFDPLTIIRAVQQLVSEGYRTHLVFIGVKHPNSSIEQHNVCAEAITLAKETGLLGEFVHFNFNWIDYADRHNYLLDADIGVSAHFDNPETRFSFRTRMLDYLWCGLPIVCSKGDHFAEIVSTNGLGLVVDFGSEDGWSTALKKLISDKAFREDCARASAECAEDFHWSKVTQSLIDVCHTITPSPDRAYSRAVLRNFNRTNFTMRLLRAIKRRLPKWLQTDIHRVLKGISSATKNSHP